MTRKKWHREREVVLAHDSPWFSGTVKDARCPGVRDDPGNGLNGDVKLMKQPPSRHSRCREGGVGQFGQEPIGTTTTCMVVWSVELCSSV